LLDSDKLLSKDKDFILYAIKLHDYPINILNPQIKVNKYIVKDKEIVLEAVKLNGNALQFVYYPLCQDREIVLEAVKSDGNSLQYADGSLLFDRNCIRSCKTKWKLFS